MDSRRPPGPAVILLVLAVLLGSSIPVALSSTAPLVGSQLGNSGFHPESLGTTPSAVASDLSSDPVVSTTSVTCNTTLLVGQGSVAACSAMVNGTNPTGFILWRQVAGTGIVIPYPSRCSLDGGWCVIEVLGEVAGPVTLEASYGGDSNNLGSSGSISLTVSSVLLSCSSGGPVGVPALCTATVLGTSSAPGAPLPTGTVTWSTNSSGRFLPPYCTLKKGSCSVRYTSHSTGFFAVTAHYHGDKKNPKSSGTVSAWVSKAYDTITLSCRSQSIEVGKSTSCTAMVRGYLPTGSVNWDQLPAGSVAFGKSTCTYSAKSERCVVVVTGEVQGDASVSAWNVADPNNYGNSASLNIQVG